MLCVLDRLPLVAAARIAKLGLLGGLAFGLTQDTISLFRGRRVAYVDALTGSKFRRSDDGEIA